VPRLRDGTEWSIHMTKIQDGWHKLYNSRVYVMDGKVMHGVYDGKTVYPYRKNKDGGWDNVYGLIELNKFRKGYFSNYYDMK
jgi:hypothetical protein